MSGIAITQHSGQGGNDDDRAATYVVGFTNDCDYVCDGVADNVQIQQAVTDLAANFGTGRIVLREGTYDIQVGIMLTAAGMVLGGQGWSTILQGDQDNYTIDIQADYVVVRDLRITQVAGSGSVGARPNCIHITGQDYAEVLRCRLSGDETVADDGSNYRQNGVFIANGSDNCKVEGCMIRDQMRSGITVDWQTVTDADHAKIINNRILGNTYYAIYVNGADHGLIEGNLIYDNVYAVTIAGAAQHWRIIGNHIHDNDYEAIAAYNDDILDTIIVGNVCYSSDRSGIRVQDQCFIAANICADNARNGISAEERCTIVGNYCYGNDSAHTNTYDGIVVTDGPETVISGNVCYLNDRHGICLAGGTTRASVSGNTCRDNGQDGIRDASAGLNAICSNTCYSNDSDGVEVNAADNDLVAGNSLTTNGAYGIMVDNAAIENQFQNNYTKSNATACARINNANCARNIFTNNCFDEGDISDVGGAHGCIAYLNYDPSGGAMITTINSPTVVGGGGGALP